MRSLFLAIFVCVLAFGFGVNAHAYPNMGNDCSKCHGDKYSNNSGTKPTDTVVPDTVVPEETDDTYVDGCPSGAICRDEAPGSYSRNGSYRTADYSLPRGATPAATTVFYPTNAEAPFSGLVFCPPFTVQSWAFRAWGPFFASHGIVMVVMNTSSTMDTVDMRDNEQRKVLDALKAENTRAGSPLNGKLDTNRLGAVGWSMGGGATWINSSAYPGLATAMSLAGHNMSATDPASKGRTTKCPILIINGATDATILGGLGQSDGVYRNVPDGIPKVLYEVRGKGHMIWETPTSAGNAVAEIALAFQKTFLDGDTRWAQFIQKPNNATKWETANIPY
jgi:pimeloyl-ACP methyl ester carboxylesterase